MKQSHLEKELPQKHYSHQQTSHLSLGSEHGMGFCEDGRRAIRCIGIIVIVGIIAHFR